MAEKGFMNLPLALGVGILGGLRPSRAPQSFFSALGPGLAQGLQMYAASQPKPQSELEKLRIAQIQAQMDASKAAAAQDAQRKAFFDKWVEDQPDDMKAFYRANPDKAGQAFLDSRKTKKEKLYKVVDPKTGQLRMLTPREINAGNFVNKLQEPKGDPNSLKGTGLRTQMFNAFSRAFALERAGEEVPPALGDQIVQLAHDYTQPRQRTNQKTGMLETYRPTLTDRQARLVNRLRNSYNLDSENKSTSEGSALAESDSAQPQSGYTRRKVAKTQDEINAEYMQNEISKAVDLLDKGKAKAGFFGWAEQFFDNIKQQGEEVFTGRPSKRVSATQMVDSALLALTQQALKLITTDERFTDADYKRARAVVGTITPGTSAGMLRKKLMNLQELIQAKTGISPSSKDGANDDFIKQMERQGFTLIGVED